MFKRYRSQPFNGSIGKCHDVPNTYVPQPPEQFVATAPWFTVLQKLTAWGLDVAKKALRLLNEGPWSLLFAREPRCVK
jgi:hypothetical protein